MEFYLCSLFEYCGGGVTSTLLSFSALLGGAVFYHLWFLYPLIFLYLFTPFLQILVKNLTYSQFKTLVVILVVAVFGVKFINVFLNFYFEKTVYYPFSELSGYLVYFLSGYFFKNFPVSKKERIIIYLLGGISLFITIYFTYYFSIIAKAEAYFYNYNLLNTALLTFAIFIFFKEKFKNITYRNKILASVVNLSFGVYLVHALIWAVLNRLGIRPASVGDVVFTVPLLAVAVFLLSLIAAYMISKIPLMAKII